MALPLDLTGSSKVIQAAWTPTISSDDPSFAYSGLSSSGYTTDSGGLVMVFFNISFTPTALGSFGALKIGGLSQLASIIGPASFVNARGVKRPSGFYGLIPYAFSHEVKGCWLSDTGASARDVDSTDLTVGTQVALSGSAFFVKSA